MISVIVPVYNAERYLDRAVQSVLCQMDGRVELILVNDGSADSSGALCDAYARDHENVRVVHKENGGLSTARNAGITKASGTYVMFLDADDYLDTQACPAICRVINDHHPDCMDFGWKYVSQTGEVTPNHHKIPKNTLLCEAEIRDRILPPLLNLRQDPDHFIYDFSCTKVFCREIIRNNRVAFDENRRIWEDRPFVVHYLKFCRSFYSMDLCLYHYVDMPGSLSRRYSMDFFRIILENYRLYRDWYGDCYDFETEYANDYWCRAIENMIFRSLEQIRNREQIEANILDTLSQEQVKHWYANRAADSEWERKLQTCVPEGRNREALQIYRKRADRVHRKETYLALKRKIRSIITGGRV